MTLRTADTAPDATRVNASAVPGEVRIDDGPFGPMPLERAFQRDDREHTIHLRAAGHPVRTKKVRFSTDQILFLSPIEPTPE